MVKISDEIRLASELAGDTYKNSSENEIAVIKIANDVFITSKEMAKMFCVQVPAVNKKLGKIFQVIS